jgi:3-hydroxybutyrate dehydrogenase
MMCGPWGPVDILANNAGIQHTAPLADMPRDTWEAILAINLSAAVSHNAGFDA